MRDTGGGLSGMQPLIFYAITTLQPSVPYILPGDLGSGSVLIPSTRIFDGVVFIVL